MSSVTAVPTDYAALHRQYYGYVVALVMKQGIRRESAEDVASEILLRFYERDFLTRYDPDYGGPGKGRFVTFLTGFIELYVRGHRVRQQRMAERFPLLADDTPHGQGETLAVSQTIEDTYNADFVEMVRWLRDSVRQETRLKTDRCDLSALLEVLLTQIIRDGSLSIQECMDTLGISQTTAYLWRKRLYAVLRRSLHDGGYPCPQNVVGRA